MTTLPEPAPESGAGVPSSSPSSPSDVCPLCGTPVGANAARCPACNMTLDGVGARASMFTRRSLWWWAGALLVLYLVVLVIVVATS